MKSGVIMVFKIFIRRKYVLVLAVILLTSLSISQSAVYAEDMDELTYNYGEALQKAIMFYEFQRLGKLPEDKRDNWRGDSGLKDGSDNGVDLTGGWYDAGDHVKFNLPMAYTITMLAWSLYENKEEYEKSGQLKYIVDSIKWGCDYLMKCHTSANEFYYQVGDGGADHAWWGPVEVMQMDRPSYKVDLLNPGSAVSSEAASALAATSACLKKSDPKYAEECLRHAKELFDFADKTKSDAGYKEANPYYISSDFYDDLSWSAIWLYLATNDLTYLNKAEAYVSNWGTESQTSTISYRWAHCWDDVHYGAQLLLARITNKPKYKESVERNFDYWTIGYNGNKVRYTSKGLAYLDNWGSLRYATTMAFLADVYADWDGCTDTKISSYKNFAKNQVDYALGSTGRSFVIGFGENSPQHPHHRTAHSSWSDQKSVPEYHRHILYGALVGGPDASDKYIDDIENYQTNEVACDYNAGFVGILARLYGQYGGNPIANFKAIETPTNDEFFTEASVNAKGKNFLEIKAYLYNESGWPARMGDKLSFKYFIDISEFVEAGYSAKDMAISVNYNNGATVTGLIPWDKSRNIYYVNADFTGTKIYPGGQPVYRKEVQFRVTGPREVNWDSSNDFSYKGIAETPGATPTLASNISVYDDGIKVYGHEPGKDVMFGDVNSDGKINSIDFAVLKKYLLGRTEAIELTAADMNNDEKVNSMDFAILKKYLLDVRTK